MVDSKTPASGRIFISYRRQETSHLAGRLYDLIFGSRTCGQTVCVLGIRRSMYMAGKQTSYPFTWFH